jgi:hypothetical protein
MPSEEEEAVFIDDMAQKIVHAILADIDKSYTTKEEKLAAIADVYRTLVDMAKE